MIALSDDTTTANVVRESLAISTSLSGKRIGLAGKLGGMNRREASNLLRSFGAVIVELDSPRIDCVVIGAEESPLAERELLDRSLMDLAAAGQLEILNESELWQRLGLVDSERNVKTLYTPAMLADLLRVSVRVIRRWHRRGLIVPVRTLHKLPYFDFQEVATARRLAELVAAGASPQAIEHRLRELSAILPDVERPLAQLSVIVEGRHVLLRQGEGLIEPGGQLRFDFSASDDAHSLDSLENSVLPFATRVDRDLEASRSGADAGYDDLLEEVFRLEEEGDLEGAIDMCHAILARDGMRADICFQLGELLYRDGQVQAARERYYAAIELDETFVEARTNLGCILAETGRHELAVAAFRGVLSLHEDYPDAHYNLALSLEAVGEHAAAAQHRARFSQLVPNSPWAIDSDHEDLIESDIET
jgi:tetratricopeptide (TPR) repeat protein